MKNNVDLSSRNTSNFEKAEEKILKAKQIKHPLSEECLSILRQITVASFLIILCTLLAAVAVYFIYFHVRRIQKIYEAQLISLVQLEASQNIRRAGGEGAKQLKLSQTIVFLDPLMLGGTTNAGITPPPYSSVTNQQQQQHQEPQPPSEN
ncbi:hypothetical protein ACTXT7_005004 [Hymenolepis weldensis]